MCTFSNIFDDVSRYGEGSVKSESILFVCQMIWDWLGLDKLSLLLVAIAVVMRAPLQLGQVTMGSIKETRASQLKVGMVLYLWSIINGFIGSWLHVAIAVVLGLCIWCLLLQLLNMHLFYYYILWFFPSSGWQVRLLYAVMPDFAQVYSFIGSVFDPNSTNHLQRLKQMDPINVETVINLKSFIFLASISSFFLSGVWRFKLERGV